MFIVDASGETQEAVSCDTLLLNPSESNNDLRMKCRASSMIELETQKVLLLTSVRSYLALQWSKNSRYYYFEENEGSQVDLFVKDVWTGETRNLTNTEDRIESSPQVWAANPDWILFDSYSIHEELGEGFHGNLSAMKTDGTQYTLISANSYDGHAAVSPIGPTLIYSYQGGGNAFLYRLGEGSHPFPTQSYGFDKFDQVRFLGSWQWSPSGRFLSGWVTGEQEDVYKIEFFLLDWEAGTSWFLPNLKGSFPFYYPKKVVWSPDERWFTFFSSDDMDKYGLWVASRDGREARMIAEINDEYDTCRKAWSPDSSMFAFQCNSQPYDRGIWIVSIEDWEPQRVALPEEAILDGWAREP